MSKVFFSTWRGELVDNRNTPEDSWVESTHKLPFEYNTDTESKAFIGWDGFALFDPDVDVVKLLCEYTLQYQKYSEACGRCAPGRWGGKILYDVLNKIARGEGELRDLDFLKDACTTMAQTSKCEIGRTVPTPVLQMMEYFEDHIRDLIENKKPSKHYHNDSITYHAKVTAPCMDACPAHVDIPAYIEGVRDLMMDDSLKATRKTMPLAHTCGRVCPHPCEDECRRANVDTPISIMELKRIGADHEDEFDLNWLHPQEQKPLNGKKVAVIGSGPAGLTGAYYLALEGVACDIYEELPVLGGEVAVGVPEYRMPIDKYNQDIKLVTELPGVKVIDNTRVDAEMMRRFEKEYDAVLIATGTRISKKVRCANERPEINGYWPAIPFLDQINLSVKYDIGENIDLTGKTIVCVGGGFTSMDVVRCSIRANAKRVIMIYRRDEKTIIRNTSYEEYHEAVEENVEFMFQTAVKEIITDENDNLIKLLIERYELVKPEDGGRPQLIPVEGADFEIEADYLMPAVSQDADLGHLPEEWEIEQTSWRTIKTDGKHYMTNRKGIFAAGDCEYGPMTIVNAVGQAKRAASVISRYVQTGEISRNDSETMEDHLRKMRVYNKEEQVGGWLPELPRQESEKMAVDVRKSNNSEVNFGFTRDQAIFESERCMRCYYIAMVAV